VFTVSYNGYMTEDEFDGVPLARLTFDEIVIDEYERDHVENRATRKGTNEYEPRVSEVVEAVHDPARVMSRGGVMLALLGYSPSAARLLRVVLAPIGHASQGVWRLITAHAANSRHRQQYDREQS
jgi:hypothetical protein